MANFILSILIENGYGIDSKTHTLDRVKREQHLAGWARLVFCRHEGLVFVFLIAGKMQRHVECRLRKAKHLAERRVIKVARLVTRSVYIEKLTLALDL